MQGVKISELFEDSLIHIENILAMLTNRGIIKESDYPSITNQFNQQKQNGLVQIQINNSNPNITFSGNIQKHHKVLENYTQITQGINYQASKILVLYVFPFVNKTVTNVFKRIIERNDYDTVIVFCDEKCIKTFKKIILTEDKDRKSSSKKYSNSTRYDLIHFDTVLINCLKNYHSPNYQMINEESLLDLCNNKHTTPLYLHKVFVNDPCVLYYGFVPFTVIQENIVTDITGGISSCFQLVIPSHTESEHSQSFTYFLN